MLNVNLVGCALSSAAFLRTTVQRYGDFLILPNFTLQSYVKRI